MNEKCFYFSVLPKGGPVIEGGKQRYSLGDTVDLNCSSINSKPAADLFWSINGEPVSRLANALTKVRRDQHPNDVISNCYNVLML